LKLKKKKHKKEKRTGRSSRTTPPKKMQPKQKIQLSPLKKTMIKQNNPFPQQKKRVLFS
jgi:hypothetical protein